MPFQAPHEVEIELKNPFANSEGSLFRPPSRTRSEASFSEFHYDNSVHPPAGVCSSRLQKHKSKCCALDLKNYVSQMHEVIRMTPEQEYNAQFERLDGPRVDPAGVRGYAGAMSKETKAKVTLLGHHEADQKCLVTDKMKPVKARGFILDISRKSAAACAPPARSTDPLRPPEEKFTRQMKRNGYKVAESRWTWNECHEVTGQDPEFRDQHRPEVILEGLSPVRRKLLTSVNGQKKYMISGAQDMVPAATRDFATADCPPSSRHIWENNKKHLQGFERGVRPKGLGPASGPEYLGESAEMWNCMSGQERPLDKWRAMSARGGQHNWMDSAQSFYAGNDNGPSSARSPTSQSQILYSARSPQSPTGSSQYFEEARDDTRRQEKRRSVLSTPSDAGSRVSMTSSGNRRWR